MSKDQFEDEDFLLSQLTAEEIAELSEMIDPDNELLPPSERLPPQTTKKPTGPYDRQHLLDHLRKEAKASKVGEDYIPFIRKMKQEKKELKECKRTVSSDSYLSEFDDMLAELDEAEIIELASELGLHGMITQDQSRGDIKSSSIPSFSHQKLDKLLSNKMGEGESEHADLVELIQMIKDDDVTLTELNVNNHPLITSQHIDQIIAALEYNTHITKLYLSNIKFDDNHACNLAKLLHDNEKWIMLNLDSNRLTNEGIRAIMKALVSNTTLEEIRMCNQYSKGGHRIEDEIAKFLEKNRTIRKLGYSFTCNGPRMEVEKWIMRNIDIQRKKRLQNAM